MKKVYNNPQTEIALVLSGMMMTDAMSVKDGPGMAPPGDPGFGIVAAPARIGSLGPGY